MIKVSTFLSETEHGVAAVPLFGPADSVFEKTAAPGLLPAVQRYIATLRPSSGAQYVLVNALGASEYFSSNINGDAFPEASLIHRPSEWSGDPVLDKVRAKDWPYGFPTFYGAHPFCFPAGTSVVMANRQRKPIEDIAPGDLVATLEGPKPVSELKRRRYEGPGVTLRLRGEFEQLTATVDHPVLVFRREQIHCRHKYCRLAPTGDGRKHIDECVELRQPVGEPEWARIDSVLPGDYLVLVPPKHGEEQVGADFAELVGWVASEGYLSKDGYTIQFSFSEKNEADIAAVKACLERNGAHVSVTPRPQYETVMLTTSRAELHSRLRTFITGVKAEKTLLPSVLSWSEDDLLRMLGAYFDGDGHNPRKGSNKGQLRVRSSSPSMLRILSDIIRSLGVEATVQWDCPAGEMTSPTNGLAYDANGSGCVAVSVGWAESLLKYTRKNFSFKPTKQMRKERVNGLILVQVTERDDIELDEDVFCLAVPGPHHFFANEVVVHNSHHKNKDPSRAYGEVELAAWNDAMKRVELVVRVDKDKCDRFGGTGVWDKLQDGQFADVSMGSRVPYDTCSITLDWDAYNQALQTFDPKRHKHPGVAVLEVHKRLKAKTGKGIRGVAVTREEYSDHCLHRMNQILPDGRKVFVYNDYPRFFDISFVFIGADRTAKVMVFIFRSGGAVSSSFVAEQMGMSEAGTKTASVDEALLDVIFKRAAQKKEGEIDKQVEPNLPPGKAVPVLTRTEQDIPEDMLNAMAASPIDKALSTAASLGIVLRPREFQKLVLIKMGRARLAADLEKRGAVFSSSEEEIPAGMSSEKFMPALARVLAPLMEKRSAFSPFIEHRALLSAPVTALTESGSSLSDSALRKMGAAYNGYRRGVMGIVASAQDLIGGIAGSNIDFQKLSSASAEKVFTPLAFHYLDTAFMDEMPSGASVQRVPPSKTTST